MAPAVAKKHSTADSVRAKSKTDVDARKTVFRPVLDNPLNIAWPPISAPIRKQLLDALLTFLTAPTTTHELPIADWRLQEHARRRGRVHGAGKGKEKEKGKGKGKGKGKSEEVEKGKGKRGPEGDVDEGRKGKKAKMSLSSTKEASTSDTTAPATSTSTAPLTHAIETRSSNTYAIPNFVDKLQRPKPPPPAPLVRPKLLDFLSVGINEVTRALETRIRWGRWELGDPTAAPGGGRAAEDEAKLAAAALARQNEQGKLAEASLAGPNQTRRRRRTKKEPTAIPPLNVFLPTSSTTLSRPSYRFLTLPVPNPSAKLPPYLLPPTKTNDFFRMLANDQVLKARAEKLKITMGRKEYAGTLLKDVIESDDPAGERAARLAMASEPSATRLDSPENENPPRSRRVDEANEMDVESDEGAQEQEEEPVDEVDDWVPVLDVIFVCKPDINPPSLVAHLPTMTAAANGVEQALQEARSAATGDEAMETDDSTSQLARPASQNVFLIPLDLGAECEIAAALALRRVAAIGLSSSAPGAEPLLALIRKHIKPLQAPWLVSHLSLPSSVPTAHLIPTHVKHLRTSAPLDPKSSNVAKKAAKRVRKEERRGELYVAED